MAVDLHSWDTSLPYQLLPHNQGEHILPPSHHRHHSNGSSALNSQAQEKHKHSDHLAHCMAHFSLQDHHKFHISRNLESTKSTGSLQSTLWSPLGSNQGSPEGSCEEPLPPDSLWESTYDVVGMFEKLKLHERGNSKYQTVYDTQSLNTSNVGPCSYQSLIHEQIRAIQLSRLKQEQILSLKQKLVAYKESYGQIPRRYQYQYDPNEQIPQFLKKGREVDVESSNGGRIRPTLPGPLYQQAGSEMRAFFLDGSGSRGASCGTGVFLPRGGTTAPSKKPGKGCSTVLIPGRVVQALQLHFDQMAATSGPKAAAFPPLHDVLVSSKDGMYSLQRRQSRKATASIQNKMILPQEWTY